MKTLLTLTLCLASMSGSAFAQDAKSECCEQGVAQTAVDKAACAVAATCAKAGKQADCANCKNPGKCADAATCAKAGKKADCANCKNPGKCADAANCAKAGKKADCAGGSCKMMGMMKGGHGMGLGNAKVMVKIMTMNGNGNMVEITPSEMSGGMKWFGRGASGSSKFDIQKMIEIEVEDMKGNFMFRSDDGDEIHGFHMIPGGEMGLMKGGHGMGLANAKVKVKIMTMDENGKMVEITPSKMSGGTEWLGRGPSGSSKFDIQKMIEIEVEDMKGNFMFRSDDGDEIHGFHMIPGGEMGWDGLHTHGDDLESRITAIEEQLSRIERMLERMAD